MGFVDADLEETQRDHERLRAEHAVLVQIFQRHAGCPSAGQIRDAYLDRLREHLVRLRSHRTLLRTF